MDNLWARRTNSSKLSLSTPSNNGTNGAGSTDHGSRNSSKRDGKSSNHTTTPGANLASPGASSAFGLGSGAFASFGSAKTPKTPGNPFESAMGSAVTKGSGSKDFGKAVGKAPSMASIAEANRSLAAASMGAHPHPLKDSWSFWYRPPISKAHGYIEYENTLHGIASVRTAEEFWEIYSHLKRPSTLPVVSDYHLFKKDIRPIWEDDVNRRGGKWVVRMKKGVADRYWEDLLLALVGDQFSEAGDDVCGAVLSMRNGEDILSIWTRTDGGRVLKVREIMKHVLNFPPNTRVEFKSHDSSILQRNAIDEQRREKASQHNDKRNNPSTSSKQPVD